MLRIFSILLLLWLPLLVLCAEDYYKLLGVDRDADERQIKRAYRAMSKKYHPDKNPDDDTAREKFVEISSAYEALSDPELRKIYDQHGHEGLERRKDRRPGAGGARDPFDLFAQFFGGGGHFGGQGGERKGPSVEARVGVPLRDFYTGSTKEFTVSKEIICDECDGSGSADGKRETCTDCGGRGMVLQKMNLAPGIFQQMQTPCGTCGGQGTRIQHPCTKCGGHKIVQSEESYEILVEPGMPRGHRIVFENEANQSPDYVAGDMVVVIWEQQPTEVFKAGDQNDGTFFRRRGEELIWREVLSLREAWMGDWTRNITHLDGHTVTLSRKRGEVVQPGSLETVKGEGMPIWREPDSHNENPDTELRYGYLLVEYEVVLPDKMDKPMEKDFWETWQKWRSKKGVNLDKDMGRPEPKPKTSDETNHGEL